MRDNYKPKQFNLLMKINHSVKGNIRPVEFERGGSGTVYRLSSRNLP